MEQPEQDGQEQHWWICVARLLAICGDASPCSAFKDKQELKRRDIPRRQRPEGFPTGRPTPTESSSSIVSATSAETPTAVSDTQSIILPSSTLEVLPPGSVMENATAVTSENSEPPSAESTSYYTTDDQDATAAFDPASTQASSLDESSSSSENLVPATIKGLSSKTKLGLGLGLGLGVPILLALLALLVLFLRRRHRDRLHHQKAALLPNQDFSRKVQSDLSIVETAGPHAPADSPQHGDPPRYEPVPVPSIAPRRDFRDGTPEHVEHEEDYMASRSAARRQLTISRKPVGSAAAPSKLNEEQGQISNAADTGAERGSRAFLARLEIPESRDLSPMDDEDDISPVSPVSSLQREPGMQMGAKRDVSPGG